ncbi:MAG: tol-pal system protein YbgF [Desulfuromonadaceae bacterium]|nr:tol-pal system protein YbgF [Desulfuromonadaceae bacterium]
MRFPVAALCAFAFACLTACTAAAPPERTGYVQAPLERQVQTHQSRIALLEQQLAQVLSVQQQQQQVLADLQASQQQLSQQLSAAAPAPALPNPGPPLKAPQPAPAAPTPTEIYRQAFSAYTTGQHETAIRLFAEFIEQYPQNPYVGNALFWQGEACLATGQTSKALAIFTTLLDQHPQTQKAPYALLKRATLLSEQNNSAEARQDLERLIRDYPGSDAARKASEALKAERFVQ